MLKGLLVSILLVASMSTNAATKEYLVYQYSENTIVALSLTDVCKATDKTHIWHTAIMQRLDGGFWQGCYIRGEDVLKDMYIIIWRKLDPDQPYDRSELPVKWFKLQTDIVPDKPPMKPTL